MKKILIIGSGSISSDRLFAIMLHEKMKLDINHYEEISKDDKMNGDKILAIMLHENIKPVTSDTFIKRKIHPKHRKHNKYNR
jgi:hypothetical protein